MVAMKSRLQRARYLRRVLTPVLGEACNMSWRFPRSRLASFALIRPVRPMMTIFMTFPIFAGRRWALLSNAATRCARTGGKALQPD
jgi:hypothetical protein